MKYAKIMGTGSYFPEKILTNHDLMEIVETSDEWIVERTGIHERCIAAKDETTTDMALNASLEAVKSAGISVNDIDGILFATITPDYAMPTAAAVLQHKLGIKNNCFAFDLNTACSGFLYALHMADGLIQSGKNKTLLLVGAEKLSAIVDYTDRNTCILFGDGAGAAILQAADEPGVRSTCIYADGSNGDKLTYYGGGSVYMSNRDSMKQEDFLLDMRGNEVFKLAVRAMAEAAAEAIAKSGLTVDDIDIVVPHQANIRIIDAVASRLNIANEKIIINVNKRGNTSAASVPTALNKGFRDGKIKKGDNVLLCAFGGGMSWGASVITI